jgi:hypothetical protein
MTVFLNDEICNILWWWTLNPNKLEQFRFCYSCDKYYFSQATPELLLFFDVKVRGVYSFVLNDTEHCLTLLDSLVKDLEREFPEPTLNNFRS